MKAINTMKAISRISSSILNTTTYLARSRRIAAEAQKDRVVLLDRLQYCLAYSNAEKYCFEDLHYLGRGREVTAENLEATASALQTRAAKIAARASILMDQFHQYRSKQYWEAGRLLMEEVEYLEEEAGRLLEAATDLRRQADFYYGEAEVILEEEKYISKWEELYDLM